MGRSTLARGQGGAGIHQESQRQEDRVGRYSGQETYRNKPGNKHKEAQRSYTVDEGWASKREWGPSQRHLQDAHQIN